MSIKFEESEKTGSKKINELSTGATFFYNGECYIVTSYEDNDFEEDVRCSVNLNTGVMLFGQENKVLPVDLIMRNDE